MSLIRLCLGAVDWLERAQHDLDKIFSFSQTKENKIKMMIDNLWIADGSAIFSNRSEALNLECVPVYPIDGVFLPSEAYILELALAFARTVFQFPEPYVHLSSPITGELSTLSSFFETLAGSKVQTLHEFRNKCQDAVTWITSNGHWPEFVWKPTIDFPILYPNERTIDILASDVQEVQAFVDSLSISGPGWFSVILDDKCSECDENELFHVRPYLICCTWSLTDGLRLGIVLNEV